MALSDVTDADAVVKAVQEFDSLGRENNSGSRKPGERAIRRRRPRSSAIGLMCSAICSGARNNQETVTSGCGY